MQTYGGRAKGASTAPVRPRFSKVPTEPSGAELFGKQTSHFAEPPSHFAEPPSRETSAVKSAERKEGDVFEHQPQERRDDKTGILFEEGKHGLFGSLSETRGDDALGVHSDHHKHQREFGSVPLKRERDTSSAAPSADQRVSAVPRVAPARLLTTSTPGPSASTPLPGRLLFAAPLVSPVPPGVSGVSPGVSGVGPGVSCVSGGASPELPAVTGRRTPVTGAGHLPSPASLQRPSAEPSQSWQPSPSPKPPPGDTSDVSLSRSPQENDPEDEFEDVVGPPVLEPPLEPSVSLDDSLQSPPPRLSLAPNVNPPSSEESSSAGGLLSSPPRFDMSQAVGSGDVTEVEGLPVNMLPRYRSGVFSSDEGEEWSTDGGPEGVNVSTADVHIPPASEILSGTSRIAESEPGVDLSHDVSADSICSFAGFSRESCERTGSLSSVDLFASPKITIGNAGSSLSSCFVRLNRLSSEEIRELQGVTENVSVEQSDPASQSLTSSDIPAETIDSQSSQGSVANLTNCFVRLCRLDMVEMDVTSAKTGVNVQNTVEKTETKYTSEETGEKRHESREQSSFFTAGPETKPSDLNNTREDVLEDPTPGTEIGSETAEAGTTDDSVHIEAPLETLDGSGDGGEAMEVDSGPGPNSEEARETAEEEISLPNLTLPNSPESGEGCDVGTRVILVAQSRECLTIHE